MELVQFVPNNKRTNSMYEWVRKGVNQSLVAPDETTFSAVVNLAAELYTEEANDKAVGASLRMFPEKVRLIACKILAEEME